MSSFLTKEDEVISSNTIILKQELLIDPAQRLDCQQ
jgi:hypothetical protein